MKKTNLSTEIFVNNLKNIFIINILAYWKLAHWIPKDTLLTLYRGARATVIDVNMCMNSDILSLQLSVHERFAMIVEFHDRWSEIS